MPRQSVHATPTAHVPKLGSVVKRACEDLVPVCVKVQRNDLGRVPIQGSNQLPCLNIPELGRVVHAAGRNVRALHAKCNANDFGLMALERMNALSSVGIPKLRGLIKTSSDYLVAERIVESDRIDYVFMAVKRQHLFAAESVPDTASAVVGARDEPGAGLVEGAIRKWQDVSSKNFEKVEALRILVVDFLNKLEDHLPKCLFLALGNQGLLKHNLIDKHLDIRVRSEVEKVYRFRLYVAIPPLVLQHDAWRKVSQQETLELHGSTTMARGKAERASPRAELRGPPVPAVHPLQLEPK